MFSTDRPLWAIQLSYDIWHQQPAKKYYFKKEEEESIHTCNLFFINLIIKCKNLKTKIMSKLRGRHVFYTSLKQI